MRVLILLSAVAFASTATAQTDRQAKPAAHPPKVVARSGRLVTARTPKGGTRSYNCKKPENAKRAVCKR